MATSYLLSVAAVLAAAVVPWALTLVVRDLLFYNEFDK